MDRQLVPSVIGLKQANELHRPVRRRFEKLTVFAKQVDDIWTADLVDMSSFSGSEKGYKYLLTVIDGFSKYGWIVALKTQTGKEVALAFRKFFLANTPPSRLWTDMRNEFYNQQIKEVLAANNVTLYTTGRWNRTMKNIMWKYFTVTVRVPRKKGTFENGFTPNWTEEVFTISSVKSTKPPTYTIKDTLGEPVQVTFYEKELRLSVQEIFRIEREFRKKKTKCLSSGKVTAMRSIRGYH